ncbi:MAG: benzoate-CoA ligase family protein [Pyrinomonadaceae bacterium]|nr:benzoate-CoA ligase family protein [Pyrinomonadaceae bacterium]
MSLKNLPRSYNACTTFIDENLHSGRGENPAILYNEKTLTYFEVAELINLTGNALLKLGVKREQRIMCILFDSPEFVASFFGAIRIGAIPIPINTWLKSPDFEYLLNDSQAVVLIICEPLYKLIEPIRANLKWLRHIIVVGEKVPQTLDFSEWVKDESAELAPANTSPDDPCFWLYSSGTTGFPKGAVHLQHDMIYCAENYARGVLNITEQDRTFSVAKLFFAYGLGNSLYFPFYVGATTILEPNRLEPKSIYEKITKNKPTLFFGVPTAFAGLLAIEDTSTFNLDSVRLSVSAGEALPKALYDKWFAKWDVEILDGIGSTETLHIFISNRPNQVRAGSSGKPVLGYEARIVDENDQDLAPEKVGNLLILGDSTCAYYWNNPKKTEETFLDNWIRTGDKYSVDEDGYFWYQGRSDDMLKVGGIWVSPVEIEATLMLHPRVLECAVVGFKDADELVKPKAFVVLKPEFTGGNDLETELKKFVKDKIASFKCPRIIEFVHQLPKTATGKVQRFRLREGEIKS